MEENGVLLCLEQIGVDEAMRLHNRVRNAAFMLHTDALELDMYLRLHFDPAEVKRLCDRMEKELTTVRGVVWKGV